jgi:hypothetical protein
MKPFARFALLLWAVTVVCQARFVLAGDEKAPLPAPSSNAAADSKCCEEKCAANTGCEECLCSAMQPCRIWYVDYRIQQMMSSHTSYQFGTPAAPPTGYAPLSKLDWNLDSTWNGIRVGVLRPKLDVHFEWLIPMTDFIGGKMEDFDWDGPNTDPFSLSRSRERFTDGQKIEFEADYKWTDCLLGMPVELWPLAGFRFQRFNMTSYAGDQIIGDGVRVPLPGPFDFQGDSITFNQQYYIGYVGAQLRRTIERECRRPITLMLQADWGATWGYNVDHHLLRTGGDRYTMEDTSGGTLHFALMAETPINRHLTLGLQADYADIRTWGGSHHLVWNSQQLDQTWTNGVQANSDQTSLTAYARLLW